MLEVFVRELDPKIRLNAKFGLRTLIWMPSTNFRSGIGQKEHRIWTQRAKMDYLLVIFTARMSKHGFQGKGYCSGGRGSAGSGARWCGDG